jgi:hypothetical protein
LKGKNLRRRFLDSQQIPEQSTGEAMLQRAMECDHITKATRNWSSWRARGRPSRIR